MWTLYNYECPSCDHKMPELNTPDDRDKQKCPLCGTVMDVPAYLNFPRVGRTKPIVLEHIAREPMTFQNKQDLSRYCEKHKVRSNMCD